MSRVSDIDYPFVILTVLPLIPSNLFFQFSKIYLEFNFEDETRSEEERNEFFFLKKEKKIGMRDGKKREFRSLIVLISYLLIIFVSKIVVVVHG